MAAVELEMADGIATVTLNRPGALNAIDAAMQRALRETWMRITDDAAVQVVILTGAGDRAFCAGGDLKEAQSEQPSFARQLYAEGDRRAILAGLPADKPLIAAVNGHAVGGGMELALACDIRICAAHARFSLPEAKIGSTPGAGGTQWLPRMSGLSDAMLMLLTGDPVDAQEAYRMRLVSRVVASEQLMPEARAIAARIVANAPLSVRAIKRVVRDGMDLPLAHAFELERAVFGLLHDSDDRIEARRAFAEKRPPRYRGR